MADSSTKLERELPTTQLSVSVATSESTKLPSSIIPVPKKHLNLAVTAELYALFHETKQSLKQPTNEATLEAVCNMALKGLGQQQEPPILPDIPNSQIDLDDSITVNLPESVRLRGVKLAASFGMELDEYLKHLAVSALEKAQRIPNGTQPHANAEVKHEPYRKTGLSSSDLAAKREREQGKPPNYAVKIGRRPT